MAPVLIFLAIFIPSAFVIYKIAAWAWKNAELEEKEEDACEKLREELEKDQVVQDELNGVTALSRKHQIEKQMSVGSGGNV